MRTLLSASDGPAVGEIDSPQAGPGFVVVKVRAAAINRADLTMMTGDGHGFGGALGTPLGLEWAGEVLEVGKGVEHLQPGDRVMAAGPGAFSESIAIQAKWVYAIPDSLSFEEAAALPVAMQTMSDALFTIGGLAKGQSVLVQGAGSAMGIMGVQLARLRGASAVIGTSTKAGSRERLAELGATTTVDTTADSWVKEALRPTRMKGVDLAIDLLGGPLLNGTFLATRVGGCVVNVGRMAGNRVELDLEQHSMRRIRYVGTTFRTRTPAEIAEVVARATADVLPAVAERGVQMPVDRVFPFADFRAAFEHVAANRHFGKVVLSLA